MIRPVLDAMQTIPAFSYLVPVVLLFGIGVPTALIATVIFAHPAGGPPDEPRRSPGPGDVDGGGAFVRLDVAPTPATGAAAAGEALDPARGQPDDHDGARHRGDRGVGGRRRSRSGRARRPQQPERGRGARRRPRHRRAGDRARPDDLGVGRPRPEATRNHHGPRVRTRDVTARRHGRGAGARGRRDLHRSPGLAPTGLPVVVDGQHRSSRERCVVVDHAHVRRSDDGHHQRDREVRAGSVEEPADRRAVVDGRRRSRR